MVSSARRFVMKKKQLEELRQKVRKSREEIKKLNQKYDNAFCTHKVLRAEVSQLTHLVNSAIENASRAAAAAAAFL